VAARARRVGLPFELRLEVLLAGDIVEAHPDQENAGPLARDGDVEAAHGTPGPPSKAS